MRTIRVNKDVTSLNDYLEVPGLGFLTVNAFVLHATEPVGRTPAPGRPEPNRHPQHPPAPATGRTAEMLATARRAPTTDPFVGPDQQTLEALLREFEPAATPAEEVTRSRSEAT